MGLFKVPKRNNISTQKILDLVENEEVSKPKITLRGTSLSAKIQAIGEKMQADLGELAGDYLLLDTREKWLDYCSCAVDNGIVAIDTETAGLSFSDIKNIAGICIYTPNNKPAYAPIGHISTITEQLLGRQITKQDAADGIKMLKDNRVKNIFHNAYFDLLVIKLCTDIWMDIYWDTLPASFLLNENESHSLKYQYDKYVTHGEVGVHKFNDIIGTEIPMNYIPPNIAGVYSSFDPIMTFKLYEFQKPYLTKGTPECARYKLEGVANIFLTEELPIIPVLAEMKYRGTKIDLDIAEKLKVKYTNLRNKAKEEFNKSVEPLKCEIIHRMDSNHDIEYPINYNSPAQIKILIYDILKSGVIFKKEETGTGKHVLDTVLADKKYKDTKLYDIVKALVEVKKYDKALNTFIEKIIGLAKNGNGVIHSNFNSCAARCISGNSLILTDDGYLHMKDYIKASDDGQEITHNSNIVNRYGKYEQATHDYKYNNRNVITMYTRYGFVITGTHNHPVMSDNNTFKCLSEYAIGDYVYVPLGYDKFPCKYQELITDTGNHRIYGKSITVKDALPNVINEQVAELLGMYHADGSKKTSNGTYTLTISNHNPKVINRVLCLYKKLFGIDGYVDTQYNKTKHNNRSNIKISSIALCWLDNYTQRGAKNKRIPKEIMMSPKSVIFAYIRGLMLDSSYAKNKTDLVISIYNHDDAVFVQSVLANAGVLSSIRVNNATYSGYNGFRLSIVPQCYNKFMSLVEFNLYDYPNRLGIEKQRKYYKEVNGGVLLRVMKLEYSTCDVFDIHVPNTHSFISNAVVSHNTGRLSSSGDINYQQLPSKLGDIRNMFTAGSGEVLISCDIKKQEVVVASLISGDRKLQEALKSGLDVYSKIASIAFDNTYEDNLEFFPDGTTNKEGKARRASAKAVTLGLLYSKGIKSISEDLHITIEKAQEVYDAVLKAFPQLANWIKSAQEKAQELGYIDGMFGRRRRLPDIKLPPYEFEFKMELDNKSKEYYTNLYTKKLDSIFKQEDKQKVINDAKYKGIIIKQNGGFIAKASREIINSSVQGSSADICKRIIIAIAKNKRLAELGCKLQMSIHDEQIVSCPKENAYEVSKLLADITAKSTGDTPVKLEVDIAISDTWYGVEYKFDENDKLVKKGN